MRWKSTADGVGLDHLLKHPVSAAWLSIWMRPSAYSGCSLRCRPPWRSSPSPSDSSPAISLQRRENVQPEIQPNRRSRTRVPLQIHSQRTLDSLLHQSYYISLKSFLKTIKLNSNDVGFSFSWRDGTLPFQHRLFPNGRVQSQSQWLDTLNPL